MKKLLLLAAGLSGCLNAQVPELIYYQFDQTSGGVVNYALQPVGQNPAPLLGNLKTGGNGFLQSPALTGSGEPAAQNNLPTGWNTQLQGSFSLAFFTAEIPVSNRLYYLFGDDGAGEFRCFTNGVAGRGHWLMRGGGLPDLPVKNAAGQSGNMIHVVYDSAAATYTSYLNGVKNYQVPVDSAFSLTGSGLILGGYKDNFGLHGLLDEFRWYNRALDSAEIARTHNIDLNIRGNCPPFSQLHIDSIEPQMAHLQWQPGNGNTSFYIEYGPAGFSRGQGQKITGSYLQAPPAQWLTGLQPNTTYEVYFGELCGLGDSAYLPAPLQFITPRLCPAPAQFQLTGQTPYTASLEWLPVPGAAEYYLIYGHAGFDPARAGQTDTAAVVVHQINGLSPATNYEVYLASQCGAMGGSDTLGPLKLQTQCAPITAFPYREDFENVNLGAGQDLPLCWQQNTPDPLKWQLNRGHTPSAATGPARDHAPGNLNGTYIYLETSLNGQQAELLTPEFDLSGLQFPRLSFWYHRFGNSMGDLRLQARTPGDPWKTISYLSGRQHYASSEAWLEESVDISDFVSVQTQFRFVGERANGFTGDMALDALSIKEGSPCQQPGLVLTAVSDTAVQLDIIGGPHTYELEWGPAGFVPGNACRSVTGPGSVWLHNFSDSSCSFSFTANQAYDLYVWNECDTLRKKLSFQTACGSFRAAYQQNFDQALAPELPDCWTSLVAGPAGTGASAQSIDHSQPHSSPHQARLYNANATGTGDTVLMISPEFEDLSKGGRQVRFFAKTNTPGEKIFLGTMTHAADAGSFLPFDTLEPGAQYREYLAAIPDQFPTGYDPRYIAVLHGNIQAFSSMYIDDFHYEVEPACPAPLAADVWVADRSFDRVTLHYRGAHHPQVEWGTPGFAPGQGQEMGRLTVHNATGTLDLTGLQPSTSYELYLRDSCGFDNHSRWIGPVSFTTDCLPASAPWSENFDQSPWRAGNNGSLGDSLEACWWRSGRPGSDYSWGVSNTSTPSVNTGPNTGQGGQGNFLYTEASWGQKEDTALLHSPWVDAGSLQNPYLTFYFHRFGKEVGDLIVQVRNPSGSWQTLDSLKGTSQQSSAEAFQSWSGRLIGLGDTLQFRWLALSQGCCGGDMAIDEVSLDEAPSCPAPPSPVVSQISDKSARVHWPSDSLAQSYELWWGDPAEWQNSAPVAGQFKTISADSLLLDSLQAENCYKLSLRSICAPGDTSAWSPPVDFCTDCLPLLAPHVQTFDQLSADQAGNLGDCWKTGNIDLSGYGWRTMRGPTLSGNTGPLADASGGNGLYIYTEASAGAAGDVARLTSPRLDLSALSQPELRFSYFMYGADIDTLHLDVQDDRGWHRDVLRLDGPQHFYDTDPWSDTTLSLSGFTGVVKLRFRTKRQAGFRGDLALDAISVADPVNCPAPTGLDTTFVQQHSAGITWQGGSQVQYEVAYAEAIITPQQAQVKSVTGTHDTLSGLRGGRQYGYFVRQICGPGSASAWSGPFYFYTPCVPVSSAPYYANFEGITPGSGPVWENCWEQQSPTGLSWEAEVATGVNHNTVRTGPHFDRTRHPAPMGTYMFLESSTAGTYAELISPAIDITPLNWPELTYHYHMFGSDIEKLEVYLERVSNGARFLVDSLVGQQQVMGEMSFWQRRIDISNFPVQAYRIVFKAFRGTSYKGDIAIDDVWIDEEGANQCPQPQAPVITARGCDTLTLAWQGPVDAVIEYGPVGFAPGSGTVVSATTPYTLTGLQPGQLYDLHITSLCGVDTGLVKLMKNINTRSGPQPVAQIQYTDSVFNSKNHGAQFFHFNAALSQNAEAYYWDFGNGQTSTDPQATAHYVFNKEYSVMLVTTNGCGSDTAYAKVNVNIGLDNDNPLARSMDLYPNPAGGTVNLSFYTANNGKARLRILDLSGKVLWEEKEKNINGWYRKSLDISDLASGVYLLEADDGEYRAALRLVRI